MGESMIFKQGGGGGGVGQKFMCAQITSAKREFPYGLDPGIWGFEALEVLGVNSSLMLHSTTKPD